MYAKVYRLGVRRTSSAPLGHTRALVDTVLPFRLSFPDGGSMLEQGRKVLRQQPFSVLLGAELAHLDAGTVELRLPLRR